MLCRTICDLRGEPGAPLWTIRTRLSTAELRRNGIVVKLHGQPLKVLSMLARHPGQLLAREQICQEIWGESTYVDFDQGLNFCIKQIRTALDDDARKPRYVETLPRRGYRFVAAVESIGEPEKVPEPAMAPEPDDRLAEAHTALSAIQVSYYRDFDLGEHGFRRALQLNPSYVTAHQWYAFYWAAQGRLDLSIKEASIALDLDPLSCLIHTSVGEPLYTARRYDEALEHHSKAVELDPNFAMGHMNVGRTWEAKGALEKAIPELQRGVALSGASTVTLAELGHAYGVMHRERDARRVLAQLTARARQGYVSPYDLALLYAGLGDAAKVFELLERALAERSGRLVYLGSQPWIDGLRNDARFESLMRRMGLDTRPAVALSLLTPRRR